jgi:hypothetical protein
MSPNGGRKSGPTHWWPRTREGRIATIAFLALLLLAEPPILYAVANRIEPRIAGLPFLYAYLCVVYAALVGVLLWAQRRRI